LVIAIAAILVVLDLTETELRHWWAEHVFTTSTVAGLLVLAVVTPLLQILTPAQRAAGAGDAD